MSAGAGGRASLGHRRRKKNPRTEHDDCSPMPPGGSTDTVRRRRWPTRRPGPCPSAPNGPERAILGAVRD